MSTNLKQIAVQAMTVEQLCERLLRENLSYLQTANISKPDERIKTFITMDITFTAGEMIEVARKIGMLPPAYDPQMLGFKDEAEANEFREWQEARKAAKPVAEIERESCPECSDGKLHVQPGGGVKCDKCTHWFCY